MVTGPPPGDSARQQGTAGRAQGIRAQGSPAQETPAQETPAQGGPAAAGPWPGRVTPLALAALMAVIAGGVAMAAYLPRPAPLGPGIAALAVAAVLLAAALTALSRIGEFAWHTFLRVGGWTLAAYIVIAGMLEFVFVFDHTPGPLLTVLTGMLVVFAVDIPLLLAFSVARYQSPQPR